MNLLALSMIVLLIKSEYTVCFINTNCFVSTSSRSPALFIDFYRPPTKLREGNVFSRVCLSVILSRGWGAPIWPLPMMHWTSLCRVSPYLNLQPAPSLYRDPRHRHVQTWISLYRDIPSPPYTHIFKLVQLETHCTTPPPKHVCTCSLWSTHNRQAGGWHPIGMLSCER